MPAFFSLGHYLIQLGMFYYKPHHSFKSPCLWVTLTSAFIFPYSLPNKLLIPQGSGGTLLRSLIAHLIRTKVYICKDQKYCLKTQGSDFFQIPLSDQISRSVMSDSLRPPESQHARPPCPSPTPGVHPDSRPSSQWCHPAISFSVVPFSSCPQSLLASESFPMSQLFAWGVLKNSVIFLRVWKSAAL